MQQGLASQSDRSVFIQWWGKFSQGIVPYFFRFFSSFLFPFHMRFVFVFKSTRFSFSDKTGNMLKLELFGKYFILKSTTFICFFKIIFQLKFKHRIEYVQFVSTRKILTMGSPSAKKNTIEISSDEKFMFFFFSLLFHCCPSRFPSPLF